jgi:hypothetical protein
MRVRSAHQAPLDLAPDERVNRGRIACGVDNRASRGLRCGDLQKPAAEPLVEIAALALEAVVAAARRGTAEPYVDRQVEDEREVGLKAVARDRMQRAQRLERDAAGIALVRECRIGETVGDDPASLCERGTDGALEMVAARRVDEKRLGERVPAAGIAADEEFSDLLRARRAAGLARRRDRYSLLLQPLDEKAQLRRLAGAFAAFDRQEASPQDFGPKSM